MILLAQMFCERVKRWVGGQKGTYQLPTEKDGASFLRSTPSGEHTSQLLAFVLSVGWSLGILQPGYVQVETVTI